MMLRSTAGADYFTAAEHWNLAHGCSRVSAGCKHCWAERMATRHRNGTSVGGRWTGEVKLFPERLEQPLHWRKPRVVAVQFMGDLFYERIQFDFLAAVYGVMAACPQHTFLVLTKRPERMLEFYRWVTEERNRVEEWMSTDHSDIYLGFALERLGGLYEPPQLDELGRVELAGYWEDFMFQWPIPNVWVGISAEDQETLDARWPMLAEVPAAKHWISVEPMLGSVELKCHGCGQDVQAHRAPDQGGCSGWFPDLVVAGGESGPGARPCDIGWIRSLRRQCADAGVAFHLKQLGSVPVEGDGPGRGAWIVDSKGANINEWPPDLRVREWPS